MNHIFKTLWSSVHQQYVVTNEKQTNHGKPAKAIATATIAAVMMLSGAAVAADAYQEAGKLGDVASWETPEYQGVNAQNSKLSAWSLKAMKASSAYALGFNGQGKILGVMDSGALLSHPEFAGGRITGTEQDQTYGSSGYYYPQNLSLGEDKAGAYKAGTTAHVTGNWIKGINDSHGTKVTGSMAANRDGAHFHGVAWGGRCRCW